MQAISQPQSCCVWHIEASDTICSPQAGLQHTHCPFSVDDGEALASYSLLEWGVFAMPSLQMITVGQMYGLMKPHKWKWVSVVWVTRGFLMSEWFTWAWWMKGMNGIWCSEECCMIGFLQLLKTYLKFRSASRSRKKYWISKAHTIFLQNSCINIIAKI